MPVYDIRSNSRLIYDGSYSLIFTRTLDTITELIYKPLSGDIYPEPQTKNTWNDFYSYPTSRPYIATPTVKENYVDVPGLNGSLDFSESLTGYPTYNNRTGTISFVMDNSLPVDWDYMFARIKSFLNGQKVYMFTSLESEPYRGFNNENSPSEETHDYSGSWEPWYYEGRFKVSDLTSNPENSSWDIEYNVKPYRFYYLDTSQDWIWDIFNFDTGIMYKEVFQDIEINGYKNIDIANIVGNAPTVPEITVNATSEFNGVKGMNVSFICDRSNKKVTTPIFLKNGTHKRSEFLFIGNGIEGEITGLDVYGAGSGVHFYVQGEGTISFTFRIGVM